MKKISIKLFYIIFILVVLLTISGCSKTQNNGQNNEVEEKIIATKTQIIDKNEKANAKIEITLKNDKAENVVFTVEYSKEQTAIASLKNYQDLSKALKLEENDYFEIKRDGKKIIMNMSADFYIEAILRDNNQVNSSKQSLKEFLIKSGFDINGENDNQTENSNNKLSDVVEVGDFVNYNSNLGLNTVLNYNTDSRLTGSDKNAIFSSTDDIKWRVLSVNKDTGDVKLIAATPTNEVLHLCGKSGFENAEDILNDIGDVYGHGKGATGGRSINVNDINAITGYKISDAETIKSHNYTNAKYPNNLPDGITINGDNIKIANKLSTYYYAGSTYLNTNSKNYEMIFNNSKNTDTKSTYWIASRLILAGEKDCSFGVRRVNLGVLDGVRLYTSNGYSNDLAYKVLPIISLQSNIKTSGKDSNGVWQLIFD